ncbi:porin [Salinimicrobium sediminilitoris]|uniref:porin n=1 Tax=Salinimicrobium sediminilitoris TaxID=2876715 RepID=UPI001E4E0D8A|nr:porin [Salinimicrobium sediminilitoris]MCC8359430.1 OprO/OprP family phosphate-selective porin [Salinimicrobium sediminilitoris]
MKKYIVYFVVMLLPVLAIAQNQENKSDLEYESIIPTKKQSLLKDVDVIFNTRLAFDNRFADGEYTGSNFSANQFRLEVKGKIHEKVSFRFRDRYTREHRVGDLDNMSRSTDLAYLVFALSPQTKLTVGKQSADWGGMELDFNPIDILEYNDLIEYADNYLIGAGLSHTLKDGKNTFGLQALNTRTKSFDVQYEGYDTSGLTPSKLPLAVVTSWRGKLFNGKVETAYSYSFFNEAEDKGMNYFVLGNKFKSNNFTLMYDFQYSMEALDNKGIASEIIATGFQAPAEDVKYIEHWLRAEYQIQPKINLLLTVMTNNTYAKIDGDSERLVTTFGLIPTVQYFPFDDLNLKLYVGYVARKYDYSGFSENKFSSIDKDTGRLSVGIIAPLLVL